MQGITESGNNIDNDYQFFIRNADVIPKSVNKLRTELKMQSKIIHKDIAKQIRQEQISKMGINVKGGRYSANIKEGGKQSQSFPRK